LRPSSPLLPTTIASNDQQKGPFGRAVFSLGRVFGIEVGIDPSWLIIFFLVTWSFGNQFAGDEAGWSRGVVWTAALVASFLYFLSILLHEFGHSITSKLLGLPVVSITLFVFGGLARLSGEPRRPRDEFLIAIAGPGVSGILGLAFLVLSQVMPDGTVAVDVCLWLGWLNLVLVAFNSIPGFPLDGGHVLRAFLWYATGSLEKATKWASSVGAVFARILIILGLVSALFFFPGGAIPGLLIAFVGWFLLRAARAGVMRQVIQRHLGGIAVGDAMLRELPAVDAWATVEEVADGPILNQGIDFLFVTENGTPRGIVEAAQVLEISESRRAFLRISQIMTQLDGLETLGPDRSLLDALTTMDEKGTGNLPVVEGGEVVGILTRQQLTRILHNRMSMESKGRVRED